MMVLVAMAEATAASALALAVLVLLMFTPAGQEATVEVEGVLGSATMAVAARLVAEVKTWQLAEVAWSTVVPMQVAAAEGALSSAMMAVAARLMVALWMLEEAASVMAA